ncbi:MMPL family transporter [Corynebacterium sp. TAE3-ERU2]|uniref:MMPL family transporter n=1 Tax=Corynebacterium sp. TAE3-ERU2 TaxID=2849497 RepID=UPI001C44579E|nr:MMPL family transporter [Corynebacterium sp. TAE3-ERU2]MBV7301994.1 MMPL family transporter [Corynebacterium sp. TAE3-ERU2]
MDVTRSFRSARNSWITLALIAGLIGVFFAVLGGAEASHARQAAPTDSESTQVARLVEHFPGADEDTVLAVVQQRDGSPLSQADLVAAAHAIPGAEQARPLLSDDARAGLITLPVPAAENGTEMSTYLAGLRADIAAAAPQHLDIAITGGAAFGADVAAAFQGANITLLAVTVLIVALLLILTYRSPVLWLIPLSVVALADRVAAVFTAWIGAEFGLEFDAGIVSVLVFGAGTNYALLLISRYREELVRHEDHRAALAAAWTQSFPAIAASNLTVVLSLLSLGLAVIPGTRGLGIVAAVGILLALVAVLLVLPSALSLAGRKALWPRIPQPGDPAAEPRIYRRVATAVMRRPLAVLLSGVVLLGGLSAGLASITVGLNQMEKFRTETESAAGFATLAEHFPAGEAQPSSVLTRVSHQDEVLATINRLDDVVRAMPAGVSTDGQWARIMVSSDAAPGTAESLDFVQSLRTAVHAVPGAEAKVGGEQATEVDARAGTIRDLRLLVPVILGINLLVLTLLLRSVAAPIFLALNVLSAGAAIAVGSWISSLVFGVGALDLSVPLLSFLFLVAMGIDYTIFLAHRAATERALYGSRGGMVEAISHTGVVITSAGVVLAGVFAALGVLPLVTLGQLGIIVGFGVLLDTILTRTIIVPAAVGVLGDAIWWPRRAPAAEEAAGEEAEEGEPEYVCAASTS